MAEASTVGRRHVKTLMQRMGIEALYRCWRSTKPELGDNIYPYRLRGMAIMWPNRCGRWTSPTSRWRATLSISPSWSTA